MTLVLSRHSGESVTLMIGDRVLGTIGVHCTARAKLLLNVDQSIRVIRSELINGKPLDGTEGRSNDD